MQPSLGAVSQVTENLHPFKNYFLEEIVLTLLCFIKQSIRVANDEYPTNYDFYKTFDAVYITLGISTKRRSRNEN
ncbi:hypothetical protein EDE11_101244 [Methylomonas methanica]|uniref:Uncharacterized protein n=1 Tax=Methylomonas methanica TaxID=421 RepID=A0ABY2CSQ4_METMH|nr:hypothetical protein EDE11_101244 [Methylomonas methanica]